MFLFIRKHYDSWHHTWKFRANFRGKKLAYHNSVNMTEKCFSGRWTKYGFGLKHFHTSYQKYKQIYFVLWQLKSASKWVVLAWIQSTDCNQKCNRHREASRKRVWRTLWKIDGLKLSAVNCFWKSLFEKTGCFITAEVLISALLLILT